MIAYLIVLLTCLVGSCTAEFLPVPRSLSYKAVYHIKAHQIPGFCCGYNCLFNACNVERLCDIPNKFSNFEYFRNACMNVLTNMGINPEDGVYSDTLDMLATKYLHMQPLYNVTIDNNLKVTPILTTSTRITYIVGTPKREIERKMEEAKQKRYQETWESIKNRLAKNTTKCQVIHFVCSFKTREGGHSVLIALVQNKSGRALYLYDNMNYPVTDRSATKQYLEFFSNQFLVSARNQWKFVDIPDIWSSTPRNQRYVQERYDDAWF